MPQDLNKARKNVNKSDAVVIIGGGPLQEPLAREAQALGLLPLVTDRNPHAPAFKLPGVQPFVLDTSDVAGHEELMRDLLRMYAVRGVCTAGADVARHVQVGVVGCARAHPAPGPGDGRGSAALRLVARGPRPQF